MAITLLTKFRARLLTHKDKEYLAWFRARFCLEPQNGYPVDPHHIMGSTFGMKFTDYLLVRAPREMHNRWQKDLPKYFPLLLPPAIENLLIYAREKGLLVLKNDEKYFRSNYENPEALNILIERIFNNSTGNRYATTSEPEKSKGTRKKDIPV